MAITLGGYRAGRPVLTRAKLALERKKIKTFSRGFLDNLIIIGYVMHERRKIQAVY